MFSAWLVLLQFDFLPMQDYGGIGKLQLWVANVESGQAKPLFNSEDIYVNAVFDKYVFFYLLRLAYLIQKFL